MCKISTVLATIAIATATGMLVSGEATPTQPSTSTTAPQDHSAPVAADHASLASAATTEPANAIVTMTVDANGDRHMLIASPPVPDTPQNRARYGQPLSNAGRRTPPAGN